MLEVLDDLRRQLARRGEDQSTGLPAAAGEQPVEDGQHEGGGLAAAGHGAGEQVAAGEAGGNAVALDGRRLGEARVGHAAQEVRMKIERRETHGENLSF